MEKKHNWYIGQLGSTLRMLEKDRLLLNSSTTSSGKNLETDKSETAVLTWPEQRQWDQCNISH